MSGVSYKDGGREHASMVMVIVAGRTDVRAALVPIYLVLQSLSSHQF
jgi:hypothetical protein